MHARGALHVAIMERHKVEKIMSFEEGFDGYPGVERVLPQLAFRNVNIYSCSATVHRRNAIRS